MNITSAATANRTLFLIEFYTNEPNGCGGYRKNQAWDINFAWVHAEHSTLAIDKLRKQQGARYCECITIDEQFEITPLAGDFRVNTPDANLFIID